MKKTNKTREMIQYSERCPKCKKEIKGYSESQVKYNLEVHTKQKHDSADFSTDCVEKSNDGNKYNT
jgi:uncharacterized protein with PIN domain